MVGRSSAPGVFAGERFDLIFKPFLDCTLVGGGKGYSSSRCFYVVPR
jgi:hypothetical protein